MNPIEEQIKSWKDRVAFLKRWKAGLENELANHIPESETAKRFEYENKVWEIGVEIQTKENLIAKREQDAEKQRTQNEAMVAIINEKLPKAIQQLKLLQFDQAMSVPVNSLIKRYEENQYKTTPEKGADLALAVQFLKHKGIAFNMKD